MWVLTLSSAAKRSCLCWHRLSNAGIHVVFTCTRAYAVCSLESWMHFGLQSMIFCCFQLSYADAQRASSADSLRAFRHAAVTVPVARCGVSAPGAAATEETSKSSPTWKYRKLHPVAASSIGCMLSQRLPLAAPCHSLRVPLAASCHGVCHWP